MKKLCVAILVLLSAAVLEAEIVLPESRVLAGPLDSTLSEFGDEFLWFPEPLGSVSPAGRSFLTGWIEIRFGEPEGSWVAFMITWSAVGTDENIEFTGGQRYDISANESIYHPAPFGDPLLASGGVLNLETGEVEEIAVFPIFRNRIIARITRINRSPFGFPGSFPPPPLPPGLPPVEFPPGFVFADGAFQADAEGRITGFEFHGLTAFPAVLFAPLAPILGFPPFAFGPHGELSFPNPDSCAPGTPPEDCPTDAENPDGITLDAETLFHPHLDLVSDELREVPPWRPAPACAPEARSGAALVAAGGRLYLLGGVEGWSVSSRVDVYDPQTGAWQEGPPLPTAVTAAQAATLGGEIVVAGGREGLFGPVTGVVQVLDLETGAWRPGAPSPRPVTGAAAAAVAGRLYLIGGRTPRGHGGWLPRPTGAVQVYDPVADSWRLAASSPAPGDRAAGVAVGSEIYVLGGLTPRRRVSDGVLIFDTVGETFRSGPPLLAGVYDAVAGHLAGRVAVVGGRGSFCGPSTGGVQVLDLETGGWRAARDEPLPTAASGGAVLGHELFVVGGRTQADFNPFSGGVTRAVQALDPARGWAVCASQPLFTAAGVLNSASLTVGPRRVSPGSVAILIGRNLAPSVAVAPPDPVLPTEMAGVSLTVDGRPAPLLAVSPGRVDFQVPQWAATGRRIELALHREDSPLQAPPVKVRLAGVGPGLFIQGCGEIGNEDFLDGSSAIACNADGTLNYAANAAAPGSAVTLQMTGLGPVFPTLADGERAPAEPPQVLLPPQVRIDGLPAEVLSATLAPGEVGVFDVTVVVPAGSRIANRVPVEVEIAGVASNRAALAVGQPVTPEPLPCLRPFTPLIAHCRAE